MASLKGRRGQRPLSDRSDDCTFTCSARDSKTVTLLTKKDSKEMQ